MEKNRIGNEFCTDMSGKDLKETKRNYVSEVWARLGKGERKYAPLRKVMSDGLSDHTGRLHSGIPY